MKEPKFYSFARPIVKCFIKIVYRPTIVGSENINKEQSLILAGNHTSNFDCLLLIASTKRCIHFLAKDSLYKGLKKILFKNMAIIPVNRKIHDKSAIVSGNKVLNENGVIGIFPEGTINKTTDVVMPFKIGAVKMAYDTTSKIVPFTITGEFKPFKNNLKIVFEPSYDLESDNLTKENEKLMNIISKNILKEK